MAENRLVRLRCICTLDAMRDYDVVWFIVVLAKTLINRGGL
jgi:hypothetical protein